MDLKTKALIVRLVILEQCELRREMGDSMLSTSDVQDILDELRESGIILTKEEMLKIGLIHEEEQYEYFSCV